MTTRAYLEAEDVELLEGGAMAYDRRERMWKPCLMYRLLIRLLFRLGCRVSEVLGISVDDIDFKQKRITIQHLKTRIKLSCPDCSARLSRTSKFCPSCGVKVEKAVASELEHRRQREHRQPPDLLAEPRAGPTGAYQVAAQDDLEQRVDARRGQEQDQEQDGHPVDRHVYPSPCGGSGSVPPLGLRGAASARSRMPWRTLT